MIRTIVALCTDIIPNVCNIVETQEDTTYVFCCVLIDTFASNSCKVVFRSILLSVQQSDSSFTVTNDAEKQQILTFQKLQPADV